MNALFEAAVLNSVGAALLGVLLLAVTTSSKNPFFVRGLCLVVLLKLLTPPLFGVDAPTWVSDLLPTVSERASTEPTDRPETHAVASEGSRSGVSFTFAESATLAVSDAAGATAAGNRRDDVEPPVAPEPALRTASLPVVGESTAEADQDRSQTRLQADGSLGQILAGLWLAGSAVMFVVVFYQAVQLSRLIRASRSVSDEVAGAVARLAAEFGLTSVPQTRIVDADFSPLVWCLGRQPIVLLPARLVEDFEPDALNAVLAHELTHIARRDHRVRQLEVLVSVLYWWHPVVWWVRRELRRVEEECCDAQVLQRLPDTASDYADALVRTVEFLQTRQKQRSALASSRLWAGSLSLASPLGRASHLRRRVEMILDERMKPKWTWTARLAVLSITAMLPFSLQAQTEKGVTKSETSPLADQADSPAKSGKPIDAKPLDYRRDRPFGGIGFPDYGPNWETVRLVTWKDCQEELGLNPKQRSRLKPLLNKLYDGRELWTAAASDSELFAAEAQTAREILTRKQSRRLDQILLQRRGLPALLADDIAEILQLTDQQRQIIDDAWTQHLQKARARVYKGTEGREGKYKVWFVALTTMTARQRKQFRKMTGPVVEQWPEPGQDFQRGPAADPDAALDAKIHFRRDRPFGGIGFFDDSSFPDSYEFLKLVTYRPVQEELDLNPAQQTQLLAVRNALNSKYNAFELRKNPELLDTEYSQALEILTREEIRRVEQIMIQRDGMRALLSEKNQEKLRITAEQAERIRRAWLDHMERGKARYPDTTGRDSAHRCWKEALLVLTADQRAKFAEMTGPIVN